MQVADIMNQWCQANVCDFIISTGDNFYPDGLDFLEDPKFIDRFLNVYNGDAIGHLVSLPSGSSSTFLTSDFIRHPVQYSVPYKTR